MNDLPELPFELILNAHLSLGDRIRSMAVSRRWYRTVNSFRPKSLCYSSDAFSVEGKRRLISSEFVSSPKFQLFVQTFTKSILSNLKHLSLYNFRLHRENVSAFERTLNSLDRLEELSFLGVCAIKDIYRVNFGLNLPTLKSIQLIEVCNILKLTLNAPKLEQIKMLDCSLMLDLIHDESVEKLYTNRDIGIKVWKLKNLKYFYCNGFQSFGSTLSSLQQLKEIHVDTKFTAEKSFKQKPRRDDDPVKIYFCGLPVKDLDDPAINSSFNSLVSKETLAYLADNHQRLAELIPFQTTLWYEAIQRVPPQLTIDLLNRFIDLNELIVSSPVADVGRFLDLLKKFGNIRTLRFECEQPLDLFDRLSEHSAVRELEIRHRPAAFSFLHKLKSLTYLHLDWSIDLETVCKLCKSLKCLSDFNFKYINEEVSIQIDHRKRFQVGLRSETVQVADLNAAIRYISEIMKVKRQNVEELKKHYLLANRSLRSC